MKILVDIGHPAHVHYFRNLIAQLRVKHQFFVTCRDTDIVKHLLDHYAISYEVIGRKKDGLVSKIGTQLLLAKRIREMINYNGIDIAMGVSGAVVYGAFKTKAYSILFDDDDQCVQPLMSKYVTPLADTVLSPDSLLHERIKQAVYYPGFHELAYLHPKVFTRDPSVLSRYGISPGVKYYILRFNAFKAHHDIHEGGMSMQQKKRLIRLLNEYGIVFITTESVLDSVFSDYRMPVPPEDLHHFLAFSQFLVSDSQTMTSEAAVLGRPSFRCNSFAGRISYLEEEEKRYKLTKAYLPHQFEWMLEEMEQHLKNKDARTEWEHNHQRMLGEKIDVTAFWTWFIENYPESKYHAIRPSFDFNQFKDYSDDI